jgi:hypothetical protein
MLPHSGWVFCSAVAISLQYTKHLTVAGKAATGLDLVLDHKSRVLYFNRLLQRRGHRVTLACDHRVDRARSGTPRNSATLHAQASGAEMLASPHVHSKAHINPPPLVCKDTGGKIIVLRTCAAHLHAIVARDLGVIGSPFPIPIEAGCAHVRLVR